MRQITEAEVWEIHNRFHIGKETMTAIAGDRKRVSIISRILSGEYWAKIHARWYAQNPGYTMHTAPRRITEREVWEIHDRYHLSKETVTDISGDKRGSGHVSNILHGRTWLKIHARWHVENPGYTMRGARQSRITEAQVWEIHDRYHLNKETVSDIAGDPKRQGRISALLRGYEWTKVYAEWHAKNPGHVMQRHSKIAPAQVWDIHNRYYIGKEEIRDIAIGNQRSYGYVRDILLGKIWSNVHVEWHGKNPGHAMRKRYATRGAEYQSEVKEEPIKEAPPQKLEDLLCVVENGRANNLKMRAKLMGILRDELNRQNLSQNVAAKLLGISASRVSHLIHGHVDMFTIDMLIPMFTAVKIRMSLSLKIQRIVSGD